MYFPADRTSCLFRHAALSAAVICYLSGPVAAQQTDAKRARTWRPAGQPALQAVFVGERAGKVVVKAGGREVELRADSLAVDDLQYVVNVRSAGEFRKWRLAKPASDMADWPAELSASFVGVRCEDHEFSTAVIELIDESYVRRFLPLKVFSDADQAFAVKLQAEQDAKLPKSKGVYKANYSSYQPGTPGVNTAESEHFVFYWGSDKEGSGKLVFTDPEFIAKQIKWFETVWDFYERRAGAPMPMADAAQKLKLNVYIAGTGLKNHAQGFAFGGEEIMMHPAALGPGSSVVPHEFTHTIQFYSGGFRDSPLVGWFWENHANWSCHQFMPAYPPALAVYFERMHYELNSSRMNYGSWPFLQLMTEDPRIGPGFCYEIWRDSRRNANNVAEEDPLQAIMRLGVSKGFFKGNGIEGFGDVIGRLAAHNVNWDFAPQYFYHQVSRDWLRHQPTANRMRVLLRPVEDRPGFFSPIFSHAPRQFGINLIDLDVAKSAKRVTVDFQGLVDESEGSDWRVTLVATDEAGRSRYSETVRAGKLSIDVLSSDKALTLAVAATPTVYKPQEFRPGYGKKPRFPYEVSFTGATPAKTPPGAPASGDQGRRHPNGGGLVAASAVVAESAYVGPDARVLGNARVSDKARIEGNAVVSQEAQVSGNAVVTGFAQVMDRAVVKDDARVRDCAVVRGEAVLAGQARVTQYASVGGDGVAQDQVMIKGFGEVWLDSKAPLGGGTVLGEDIEVYLGEYNKPINGGLIYGYTNAEFLRQDLKDNNSLYARYDFTQPRAAVLKDSFADNQGVLRGKPKFVQDSNRAALSLNGRDQYALLEGQVADAAELTIDGWLKWTGGAKEQAVFAFGSEGGEISFIPANDQGKPAVIVKAGKRQFTLASTAALPKGKWTRTTVILGKKEAVLLINAKAVARLKAPPLTPADVPISVGYLGRRLDGTGFYSGLIGEIAVYRHAMPEK